MFPSPRLRAVAWLLAPFGGIGPEGQAELRQSLFRRLGAVLASAGVTLTVAGLASYRHPTWPFLCWLGLEIALASVRIPVVIQLMRRTGTGRRGQRITPWSIDLFVCFGTVWSGLLGVGTMLCLASGDPGLSILAALTAMGTVGAQCARNPGAPRLNALQIILITGPFSIGAAISPIPLAIYATALAPLYLYGMLNITRELHKDYVSLITTRLDNRHRALHCELTGLPNRTFFNELLAQVLDKAGGEARGAAVLYLDLDGFKAVNDLKGHAAGDGLLKQVGARLRDNVPEGALVTRLGGDEFVILMETDDVAMVEETARTVVAALGHPFQLGDDGAVAIGVSIGIAMSGNTGERGNIGIVERADAALYEAKRAGKGIVRWHGQKPAHSDGRDLRNIGAAMRELDGSRSPGIRVSGRS